MLQLPRLAVLLAPPPLGKSFVKTGGYAQLHIIITGNLESSLKAARLPLEGLGAAAAHPA